MKKITLFVLLSVCCAAPAIAAEGKNSVGVNYGFDLDGVVGIQGEMDISAAMPNKAPVSIQVFWKNYAHTYRTGAGTYQYSYNALGAAGIYDFGPVGKLDKRFKPYAGLGLIALSSSLSGPNVPFNTSADSGGLYFTAGVRFDLTQQANVDLSLNNYGGLTIGANLKF